ncbi:MAG: WecB/TagA/CpsF family glycosyltransferase [Phycisphaerae bacterium]
MQQNKQDQSPTVQILGADIDVLNYQSACEQIDAQIERKEKGYVCVVPVHSVIVGTENKTHQQALKESFMNTPDGMPLVWVQKLMGQRHAERVYGPDLMLHLLRQAELKGHRVFLYGSQPETLIKLKDRILKKFPALRLAGAMSPPFGDLDEEAEKSHCRSINRRKSDLVFVALGCPNQEAWMLRNHHHLDAVAIGVGAAFDFLAGTISQAPKRMQKLGLEWLFRLMCEPRRLWKRYLFTNTAFIARLLVQFVRGPWPSAVARERAVEARQIGVESAQPSATSR